MDWATRWVLRWELSNTLDSSFCVEALERALSSGRQPEVFNTDQGSQFTSRAFTDVLIRKGISISMDGAGRAFDNIMVERLWRTVKYEDVYQKDYSTMSECRAGMERYFAYYNHTRRHSSLGRRTPATVYGANPSFVARVLLVEANDKLRIRTGAGGSGTTVSAVPASLRFASTGETSGQLRLEDLPPYSRKVSVQTKGTG
ncbi:MAG: integrase core domain-containing protein [Planctomycetota bacterium]|nr:integrase core domain-containing protein [Planctomycetota bacterium]